MLCTSGICSSEEVAIGTRQCAASSWCRQARKPQLVVMPSTPSAIRSSAAALNISSMPSAFGLTMRSGVAPRTTAYCTGKRNVGA